jgi:hypothetical protein
MLKIYFYFFTTEITERRGEREKARKGIAKKRERGKKNMERRKFFKKLPCSLSSSSL